MDARGNDRRVAGDPERIGDATRHVSVIPDELELVELSRPGAAQPRGWLLVVGVLAAAAAMVVGLVELGVVSLGPRHDEPASIAALLTSPTPSTAEPSAEASSLIVAPAQSPSGGSTGPASSPAPSPQSLLGEEPVGVPSILSMDEGAVAYYRSPDGTGCAIVDLHRVAERRLEGDLFYSEHLNVQLSDQTCKPSSTSNGVDLASADYRMVALTQAWVAKTLTVGDHSVSVDVSWTATGTPEARSDTHVEGINVGKDVAAHLAGAVLVDGVAWTADQQTATLQWNAMLNYSTASGESAPPSPAQASSSPTPAPVVVVVVAGDTLASIADRYGVALADVLAANPQIPDKGVIHVGDRITIPPAIVNRLVGGTHDPVPDYLVGTRQDCGAFGWAFDPNDPMTDVAVRILVDGKVRASVVANEYRADLAPYGIGGDGTAQFVVDLSSLVTPGVAHEIRVQAQDLQTREWVDLNNTPRELTCGARGS